MTDYPLEATINIRFTTRAFSTGIPTTLAGTPAVAAYEDESTTQITAGITLGVDHDSVTGLNLLTIAATAANGYESGKDYDLILTAGTVDSVSVVGEVVGRFTIGRSAAAVDLANGTDGLSAIKAVADSVLTDTAEIGAAGAGLTALATAAALATVDGNVDAILVDTAEIGTAGAGLTEAGGTGDQLTALATAAALTTVDTVVDAIKVVTDQQDNIRGTGTCDSGGSTTAIIASLITPSSVEDDQFNGRIIIFHNDTTTTALRGQATSITDYTHSTLTFTVDALSEAPASGDLFDIV